MNTKNASSKGAAQMAALKMTLTLKAFEKCVLALRQLGPEERKRALHSTAILLEIPFRPISEKDLLP